MSSIVSCGHEQIIGPKPEEWSSGRILPVSWVKSAVGTANTDDASAKAPANTFIFMFMWEL